MLLSGCIPYVCAGSVWLEKILCLSAVTEKDLPLYMISGIAKSTRGCGFLRKFERA